VTNGLSTTADTNIVVAYAPVVFNVAFPHATQYADYSYLFTATGNGAITYSILEALPNGLSLKADALAGQPQVSGGFPLTITAKDIQGFSQNVSATLTVDPAAPPVVPPAPPAPVACSGSNEIISLVNPQAGALPPHLPFVEVGRGAQNGGKSITIAAPPAVKYTFNGVPYGQFPIGALITYTGVLDQANFFCVTDTVSISPGLTFPAISLPKGQAGIAYTKVPVIPTGGVAPYTIVVQNLPAGLNFTNSIIGGIPQVAGSYTVSISINDNNGQSSFQTLPLVIDAAPVVVPPPVVNPPVSCAKPKGAVSSAAKSIIASVNGSTVKTASGIALSVLPCATVEWNRSAHVYKVGDRIEWKGWVAGSVVDAAIVTLN
jgi:hypothetical protein